MKTIFLFVLCTLIFPHSSLADFSSFESDTDVVAVKIKSLDPKLNGSEFIDLKKSCKILKMQQSDRLKIVCEDKICFQNEYECKAKNQESYDQIIRIIELRYSDENKTARILKINGEDLIHIKDGWIQILGTSDKNNKIWMSVDQTSEGGAYSALISYDVETGKRSYNYDYQAENPAYIANEGVIVFDDYYYPTDIEEEKNNNLFALDLSNGKKILLDTIKGNHFNPQIKNQNVVYKNKKTEKTISIAEILKKLRGKN